VRFGMFFLTPLRWVKECAPATLTDYTIVIPISVKDG